MMICEYWPKGYADPAGPSRMEFPDETTRAAAGTIVHTATGGWGTVISYRPKHTSTETVDPAYARMMSQHDNS